MSKFLVRAPRGRDMPVAKCLVSVHVVYAGVSKRDMNMNLYCLRYELVSQTFVTFMSAAISRLNMHNIYEEHFPGFCS